MVTGQSPHMTQGHLESVPDDGWEPAPDFQFGGAGFKPAEKFLTELEALQAAERLKLLRGTGFSPYVTTVESTRL